VVLVQIAKILDDGLGHDGDERVGVRLVRRALDEPARWIAENAGLDGRVVTAKVREMEFGHGLDAATEEYRDLAAAGIVDPVKVVRSAVANAASIAGLLLTTETLIVEKPKAPEPAANGHGHGHGHGHQHGPGY
jgi:chaperonin GroEL